MLIKVLILGFGTIYVQTYKQNLQYKILVKLILTVCKVYTIKKFSIFPYTYVCTIIYNDMKLLSLYNKPYEILYRP
jgi:hypothetical protein